LQLARSSLLLLLLLVAVCLLLTAARCLFASVTEKDCRKKVGVLATVLA